MFRCDVSFVCNKMRSQQRDGVWYLWCSHNQWCALSRVDRVANRCPMDRFDEGHGTCRAHVQAALRRRKRQRENRDGTDKSITGRRSTLPTKTRAGVTSSPIVHTMAHPDRSGSEERCCAPALAPPTTHTQRQLGACEPAPPGLAGDEGDEMQRWLSEFVCSDSLPRCLNDEVDSELAQAVHIWRGPTPHFAAIAQHLCRSSLDAPPAMFLMGVLKMHGLGVPQDSAGAIKLWEQAAMLNFVHAKFVLACCLMLGCVTAVDMYRAHLLLAEVAAMGHPGVSLAYDDDGTFQLCVHPKFLLGQTFTRSFPCACQNEVALPCACSNLCGCIDTGCCRCKSELRAP